MWKVLLVGTMVSVLGCDIEKKVRDSREKDWTNFMLACTSDNRFVWYGPTEVPAKREGTCFVKSFLEYCKDQNLDAEKKHTIEMLKAKVVSGSCEDLMEQLVATKVLDLSNSQITDVLPLVGIVNARHIDLSNNNISDVWGLAALGGHIPNSGIVSNLILDNNPISTGEVEKTPENCPTEDIRLNGRLIVNITRRARDFCKVR